jgi:hypothetical protein
MSTSQEMNSRCFTCILLAEDAEIGEKLTVLTLRQIHFAHPTPVILTASEVRELRHLLNQWPESGPVKKKGASS